MRTRFLSYLDELTAIARTREDVVGHVAFGAENGYRQDLSWLPEHDRIALSVVEHHGGVKVLYDDGRRLEFGIADVDSFATWAGAPADVLIGDDAVHRATAIVVARRPEGEHDAVRELGLMLTQIHSGVGRARRGETLSGSGLVRFEAVNHLARALAARLGGDTARLDALDPRRRFDLVYPDIAMQIELAYRLSIEDAARALVDLAEERLAPGWEAFPHAGVVAVRANLGWSQPNSGPLE